MKQKFQYAGIRQVAIVPKPWRRRRRLGRRRSEVVADDQRAWLPGAHQARAPAHTNRAGARPGHRWRTGSALAEAAAGTGERSGPERSSVPQITAPTPKMAAATQNPVV